MQSSVTPRSGQPLASGGGTPLVIGTSFRTSGVGFRERLVSALGRKEWLRLSSPREWTLVSTCNRVELILAVDDPEKTAKIILDWSMKELGDAPFYVLSGRRALVHLFRVASGLDSMVVSDSQILGQLRAAGKAARVAGLSRVVLSPLFDAAVSVGSRVKPLVPGSTESVGSGAVAFALKKLGHPPRTVVLVGTGKMSKTAASSLKGSRIMVVSRRRKLPPALSGLELVRPRGLREALRKSELVICATAGRGYSISKSDIGDRRRRIIIDLGFPRNVDPALRQRLGVILFDLDDLAKESPRPDPSVLEKAERAVEREAESFERWLNASKISPELSQLFKWAEDVRTEETAVTLRRLGKLTPREKRLVEAMGRRITGKILSKPAAFAKLSTPGLPQSERMRLLREVFMEGPA